MHFVRTEDLKTGMRLARPVYNKKSILLFDRNSLLSLQAIESIRNFGLIGVYVLEPAEPLPPLTQEDLEFERFQIQAVSAIEEEQDRILKTRKQNRTQSIADMVIRNYGHLDEKINFYQNLRKPGGLFLQTFPERGNTLCHGYPCDEYQTGRTVSYRMCCHPSRYGKSEKT